MPRLAPKLSGLARWLPWHRRSGGGENGHGPQEDPLLEAGRRLRQEREQRLLSAAGNAKGKRSPEMER